MTRFGRGGLRRLRSARQVALFAILFGALCSVPMLARGAEAPEPGGASSSGTPNVESLDAAISQAEAESAVAEDELKDELATPAAVKEREESQTAYAQIASSEASELLLGTFAPQISELNEDPGRLISEVEVEKMLGSNAARVSSPERGRAIIESTLPLTGEEGGPMDLSLERTEGAYAPVNAGTPTKLPATAEGSITVGGGISIQMPASDDHEAVQIGGMSLFYPETEETTDTMVAPVAGGVEIFDQLRSAESPEELRFDLEMPPGAHLAASAGGGAEIVSSAGTPIEEVPPPTAVDAQGAVVPITTTVEGNSLVLDVELAAAQPAFPVLVDPAYLEEPTAFGEWSYANVGAEYGHTQTGSNLKVWSLGSSHFYPENTHGAYTYASPGPTAWIEAGTFRSISFFPNSCGGTQPHGYIGLFNPGANRFEGSMGIWEGRTPTGGAEWQTGWVGQPGTQWAVFGVGTKSGASASNSCVHEFYLGNYSLQEKDTTAPVVTSVSGVPLNQWFDPAKVGGATVTAEDTGFGVYEVSIGNEGGVTNSARPNNCTGTSGSRCPHVFSWPINPPYVAGKRAFYANAQDAMGNNTASGLLGYTYADPYAPAVEFTGQFARATEEVGFSEQGAHNPAGQNELSLPTYVLHISATDGSNATPQTMESGVQRVQVFLDGAEQSLPWGTQTCPASESSCGLSGEYKLTLSGLGAGIHKLKVVATDRVGHVREREIEFEFIPATGEGENQVLEHFPLHPPAGGGTAGEEAQPEVAVNVMNGNLVFHQQDAEVATTDAGIGIERYYNSELPQAQSGEFGAGWTLDDAPELEPGQGGAGKATLVEGEGAMETAVPLPAQEGQQTFDPATQASIAKVAGGYTVTDEGEGSGPTADLAAAGQPSALTGSAEATLDLERNGGELSGIAVDDPGTAAGDAEKAVTESPRGFLFAAAAGGVISEGGKLSDPVATATDSSGDVYVADAGHDRVQEFSSTGTYLRQFGGAGTGAGQFSQITAIAISGGNVYVSERGRVEEFSGTGTFIRQIGSEGTGNGQFKRLTAIAVDATGHLWTLEFGSSGAETTSYGGRIQELTAEGSYMAGFEIAAGSGAGQLGPQGSGLALDKEGHVWIADTADNRIEEFSGTGTFIRQVGSKGTAAGQFNEPQGIAIDGSGNVWVADTGNDRVQEFTSAGRLLMRFGRVGGDPGQFSRPLGLGVDGSGNVWTTEARDDRIDKWEPSTPSSTPPVEPAPIAAVETSGGLVQSIKGQPTGSITYQHEGARLTGASGPEGTSHYTYDAQHRLQRIELPQGTSAEIGYDSIGRVISLKIVVEGAAAETTSFEYDPEGLRETVVRRPGKAVHYAISEEGSVLRWWNTPKPPEIEELTGSLWAQRGEVNPGTITNGEQSLETKAYSPEGLHSIQIVANGSQVVAEKTCEKAHDRECLYLERIYVTNTQNWSPGIVPFEVVATDANGFTSSRRFWDNIPYTPPPANSELEPPTFEAIQLFREEFGLDLDLKGNERGIAERIYNLIDAWHEPNTPEGQVARASMARWGVPLRAVDVAEMEYRERYAEQASKLIPAWAEHHAQSTFAGYYINQRQGGRIHVGFTGNQSQQLSQLVSEIGEIAPGRMSAFEIQPTYSYKELLEAWHADAAALGGQPVAKSMVSQSVDVAGNKVEVKTEDVAGTESFLSQFGAGKFEVIHATGRPALKALNTRPAHWTEGNERPPKYNVREAERRIFAGDAVMQSEKEEIDECTASWGATAPEGIKPNGEQIIGRYVVTAGHCFKEGPLVYRFAREEHKYVEFPIGTVRARSYEIAVEGHETDAEAIALQSGFSPPSWIFANQGSQLRPGAPALPVVGAPVCHSGVEGGFSCGTVTGLSEQWFGGFPEWLWEASISSCEGDSGGPYWQPEGNIPLGIETGGPSHKLPDGRFCGGPSYFTPLLESREEQLGVLVGRNIGVLQALGMRGTPGLTFYGAVN